MRRSALLIHRSPLRSKLLAAVTALPCQHLRDFAADSEAGDNTHASKSSWVPEWLQKRLPGSSLPCINMSSENSYLFWKPQVAGALGGTKEAEELTLDSYATSLRRARQLGSVTGFIGGTSKISDPLAQGNLRLYEEIIGCMTAEEKANLALFNAAAMGRVAAQVGCTAAQVVDCIAKFEWMRGLTARVAQLKREGKPMPTSVEELERSLGTYSRAASAPSTPTTVSGVLSTCISGGFTVPEGMVSARGVACPLARQTVGRSTKCPLTKKSFKACCGRRLGSRA